MKQLRFCKQFLVFFQPIRTFLLSILHPTKSRFIKLGTKIHTVVKLQMHVRVNGFKGRKKKLEQEQFFFIDFYISMNYHSSEEMNKRISGDPCPKYIRLICQTEVKFFSNFYIQISIEIPISILNYEVFKIYFLHINQPKLKLFKFL